MEKASIRSRCWSEFVQQERGRSDKDLSAGGGEGKEGEERREGEMGDGCSVMGSMKFGEVGMRVPLQADLLSFSGLSS